MREELVNLIYLVNSISKTLMSQAVSEGLQETSSSSANLNGQSERNIQKCFAIEVNVGGNCVKQQQFIISDIIFTIKFQLDHKNICTYVILPIRTKKIST